MPDSTAPLVLFNGRFVERKGIRELMEAIEIVLAQAPAVQFVLAGGHRGCSAAQMESWLLPAQLRPMRTQIQFTGWLTPQELTNWYCEADILVVPSWYEPFGMVILEGMLHGMAIAASAVGGPKEILDHEQTGLLFPREKCKSSCKGDSSARSRPQSPPLLSPPLAREWFARNGFGTTLLRR